MHRDRIFSCYDLSRTVNVIIYPTRFSYDSWKELYERCIQASLYLREALTVGVVEVEKIHAGDEFHYVTKDPVLPENTQDSSNHANDEQEALSTSVSENITKSVKPEGEGDETIVNITLLIPKSPHQMQPPNATGEDPVSNNDYQEQQVALEERNEEDIDTPPMNDMQLAELDTEREVNDGPNEEEEEALRDYDSGVETEEAAAKTEEAQEDEGEIDGVNIEEADPSASADDAQYMLQLPGKMV